MSVDKKTLIGTIDMTPTWEQQARMCIEILKEKPNTLAAAAATNELIRMGTLLDQRKVTTAFLDPHDLLPTQRDTEQWFDASVFGSQYEQQTSTKGNWRHRLTYNHSPSGDWTDGRAPDTL